MSLSNLVTHLAGAGLGLVEGTNLFEGMASPPELGASVTLRQSGGEFSWETQGQLKRLSFQMVVQDHAYGSALDLANASLAALTIRQSTVGTAFFYEVRPREEPVHLSGGREESGVHTFVVNFDAVWREA